MKEKSVDVLVVGGGAAGLAAAAAAANAGTQTLLLERDDEVGGVLNQCIHTGFGVHRYREELAGPEFGHRLLAEVREARADIVPGCSVLEIDPRGPVVDVLTPEGMLRIHPKSVVWASGARERPYGSLMAPGPRPAGIYTAGLAQRFVNIHGFLPGKRALILGSGDIGLIMARRLHLEGMEVAAVVELQPSPGGLARNVVQCLDDYDIPLLLSHGITKIQGRDRLTGVTIARLDESHQPVPGTERQFAVDTLILSIGLIPENELIMPFTPLDPVNRGPHVNSLMQTRVPWLFAAGNNVAVFDLVDSVAAVGETAGQSAALYAQGNMPQERSTRLVRGKNVFHLVPTSLVVGDSTTVYLRASRAMREATVRIGDVIARVQPVVRPSEMVEIRIPRDALQELTQKDETQVEITET
ncbi:MAG: FAD-dependent oxidoreductase [Nitrospirae bacterium]|nr:FAD-dependent oxidoreductase [Nitrospirota bacterium]